MLWNFSLSHFHIVLRLTLVRHDRVVSLKFVPPLPPSFDFMILESRGSARERYPVACQRCGSERVKADSLIVLSVLHGAVPAYRLLPPSLRRERGAGACVCVAVCHSGRTHSIVKQPALLKTCRCCPLAVVCGYLNQKRLKDSLCRFFVLFTPSVVTTRRVLRNPPAITSAKRPGETKHGTIRSMLLPCLLWDQKGVVRAAVCVNLQQGERNITNWKWCALRLHASLLSLRPRSLAKSGVDECVCWAGVTTLKRSFYTSLVHLRKSKTLIRIIPTATSGLLWNLLVENMSLKDSFDRHNFVSLTSTQYSIRLTCSNWIQLLSYITLKSS